ncbi:type I restriction-modification system subunit M N-terminal domain-containing protein [Pinirhizobacter soli]|uniref:type I restriction-modification system subunit M N-terminal domain-containing protein n=1 Tax=Pinirhizobacter soli TaxID=2786953 RepID=UPI002029F45D|nr:type I restriction-modification system subunit M N-terminal domain-containing protein [Pinirhizobacter soli]
MTEAYLGPKAVAAKIWGLCNVLRGDGISYNQYISELTYLLFLKIAEENGTEASLPVGYRWRDLAAYSGPNLLGWYQELLTHLGASAPSPMVRSIYTFPTTVFSHSENLRVPVSGSEAKLPAWPRVAIASLPPANGFVLSLRYRMKDGDKPSIGYRAPIPQITEISPVRNLVVTNMRRWRKYRVGAPLAFILSIIGFIGMIVSIVWMMVNVWRSGHLEANYFKWLLVMVSFEGIWLVARDIYAEREKVIPKGLRVWMQTAGEPLNDWQLDLAVGKRLAGRHWYSRRERSPVESPTTGVLETRTKLDRGRS